MIGLLGPPEQRIVSTETGWLPSMCPGGRRWGSVSLDIPFHRTFSRREKDSPAGFPAHFGQHCLEKEGNSIQFPRFPAGFRMTLRGSIFGLSRTRPYDGKCISSHV